MGGASSSSAVGPFGRLVDRNLIRIEFPLDATDAELDAHAEALEAWCLGHRFPKGFIVVLHSALVGTATQRRKLAALEERLLEHDKLYTRACGIVAPNAVTRGLVTAVFWLAPPAYPYRLFDDPEPALSWVRSELR